MKMRKEDNITTLDEILDNKYGKREQKKENSGNKNLRLFSLAFYLRKQDLNLV